MVMVETIEQRERPERCRQCDAAAGRRRMTQGVWACAACGFKSRDDGSGLRLAAVREFHAGNWCGEAAGLYRLIVGILEGRAAPEGLARVEYLTRIWPDCAASLLLAFDDGRQYRLHLVGEQVTLLEGALSRCRTRGLAAADQLYALRDELRGDDGC